MVTTEKLATDYTKKTAIKHFTLHIKNLKSTKQKIRHEK